MALDRLSDASQLSVLQLSCGGVCECSCRLVDRRMKNAYSKEDFDQCRKT